MVYLGQADNVRARLQQYGRTGSHLDTGNPLAAVGKAEMNTVAGGPGLFREVFSRGYSVMFRCALVSGFMLGFQFFGMRKGFLNSTAQLYTLTDNHTNNISYLSNI